MERGRLGEDLAGHRVTDGVLKIDVPFGYIDGTGKIWPRKNSSSRL